MPRQSRLFGPVFAFNCFTHALETLPTTLVVTCSCVNPVIAVFLGWLLIDEPVTIFTCAGTVLVIGGDYGMFRGRTIGLPVRGPASGEGCG